MPDDVLTQVVRIPMATGLPEDVVENVFHIRVIDGDPSTGAIDDIAALVANFYNDAAPLADNAVGTYLAGGCSRAANACTVVSYVTSDLTGETPMGSPVATFSFTLPAAGVSEDFPNEVAVCLSYNADLTDIPVSEPNPDPPPATIRPQQRRRGRLFIGPLNSLSESEVLALPRPTAQFREDLGLQALALMDGIPGTAGSQYRWAVWSKADAALRNVVGGYVDDAWDTQRRRGVAATTRTTWP